MKKFKIEMKNGGIMTGELYPDKAPKTVQNFEKLVRRGFYDGLIFHRVIPGFMIQGGAPMVPERADLVIVSQVNLH